MNLKLALMGAVGALALAATSANAVTVNLDTSGSSGNAFYFANNDFVLPTNFINPLLNISYFNADDRAVLQLNSTAIDQTGIFAPGNGSFNFGSGNVPWFYPLAQGARNINITTGFLTGANSFRVYVNDTHAGIGGDVNQGSGNLEGAATGPTGFEIHATLTYDLAPDSVVPEPASWALMIGGFGIAGAGLRRRRRETAAAA